MSPEQARGEAIDHRTDVFSFGVVLYEMATGALPFAGNTSAVVFEAILNRAPAPPATVNPEVPPDLDAVISRALDKDRHLRYQAAADLRDDLVCIKRALDSGSAPSPRPSASKDARRGPRAASRLVPWILAVVLLAAGVYVFWPKGRGHDAALEAALPALAAAARARNVDDVFARLQAAGLDLSDPRLGKIAALSSGTLQLECDPTGAGVTLARLQLEAASPSIPLPGSDRAPVTRVLVPGEYVVEFAASGMNPLTLRAAVARGGTTSVSARLAPATGGRAGMVLVPEGDVVLASGRQQVPAFLIDRHEVTNAEFQKWIGAGGYQNVSLWPEGMRLGGRALDRQQALSLLVDRTGVHGPRFWSDGTFPDGQAKHPVVGVSWLRSGRFRPVERQAGAHPRTVASGSGRCDGARVPLG